MVNGLTKCVQVKATPNSTNILQVSNPTGMIPKLVHVKCDHNSSAYADDGSIKEGWFIQSFGFIYTRNGSTGDNVIYGSLPVQQTPTSNSTYFFSANNIELYKGAGTLTGLWSTSTEYTVEIYINDTTPRIAEYGKYLSRSYSDTAQDASWCYTEWIDLNPSVSGSQYIVDNCTNSNHTWQGTYTPSGETWWYGPRNQYNPGADRKGYQIRFSIPVSAIDDSYAYNEKTGQIFFAGKNTQYYGYSFIDEIPT